GKDIWKDPITVKEIIGNVPEMANVYMDLTALQNLYFVGEIYGVSKEEREQRAKKLLKQFDLFEKRHLQAKKYSKGMKQRLLLCMALMNDPKILFLDEPTSGLDVQSSRIIKKIIKKYNDSGITVFMTTHDMSVANEMCDNIAIINQGEIIELNSPERLREIEQEYQAINIEFLDEVSVEELKKIDSLINISPQKEGFHIIVDQVDKALKNIAEFAKQKQIKIKEFNTHKPSLEDVFVKIIKKGGSN
ncbi:MAG: ATP-binding cassette domain-containing protein, partial [Promethearchaeia archaeon]